MSKRRCRTCSGRDGCIHVNIFDQKTRVVSENNDVVASDEVMDSQNEHLSPLKDQNRFKQQFSYPPTEKDKETYNKINTTENMFACGRMIPTGHRDEKCECGHTFSQLVIESNKPVIHHSRPTYDSRDGPLSTYMLTTENCEHVKGGIQKKKGLKYLSLKQSSLRTPTHTHSTLLCYVSFFYWVEKYSTGW